MATEMPDIVSSTVTAEAVRGQIKRCLAGDLSLFDLWEWAMDGEWVTTGTACDATATDLLGDISLAGAEWTGDYGTDDDGFRRILQSLHDIGCAPFHWVCEHEPKHEVA